MSTILQKIIEQKKLEVQQLKRSHSIHSMNELIEQQEPVRGFTNAIKQRVINKQNAVIAECKKASPSQGVFLEQYLADKIAKEYEQSGACCLSVLTDEFFFQGSIEDLQKARKSTTLPVIRKDFIIDPLQIFQSRAIGADCILLIVSALGTQQLDELYHCAHEIGLDVLIETHNTIEIDIANHLSPPLLGINNRNLNTFEVDLNVSISHKDVVPKESIIITESGIKTIQDVKTMNDNGIYAFLVGESLIRQPSPGQALKRLFSF